VTDVILPVLDEARAIPWVLARIPRGYSPLVVDNGSSDGSAELAERLGARVIREHRRGFGAACFAGLAASTAAVVCFMDCDGSLDPFELPSVAEPVRAGRADLVLGARRPRPGAWPARARIANRLITAELLRRSGVRLSDLGPMRAAPRKLLLDLDVRDRRFGWPLEMVLRAARAGWRIEEAEVGYGPRSGRSKVTGSVRGSARAARDMAAVLR